MKSKRFMSLAAPAACFVTLALAAARMSSAQEMSAEDKKMMEMMMKYGTPGKNHELLKKYVGDCDVEMKTWPKPDTEPRSAWAR